MRQPHGFFLGAATGVAVTLLATVQPRFLEPAPTAQAASSVPMIATDGRAFEMVRRKYVDQHPELKKAH
jgi:hypothetical protein